MGLLYYTIDTLLIVMVLRCRADINNYNCVCHQCRRLAPAQGNRPPACKGQSLDRFVPLQNSDANVTCCSSDMIGMNCNLKQNNWCCRPSMVSEYPIQCRTRIRDFTESCQTRPAGNSICYAVDCNCTLLSTPVSTAIPSSTPDGQRAFQQENHKKSTGIGIGVGVGIGISVLIAVMIYCRIHRGQTDEQTQHTDAHKGKNTAPIYAEIDGNTSNTYAGDNTMRGAENLAYGVRGINTDYLDLKQPAISQYKSLKKPEDADFGSDDYADPEKYTEPPALPERNPNNQDGEEEEEDYVSEETPETITEVPNDDDEYFKLEAPDMAVSDEHGTSLNSLSKSRSNPDYVDVDAPKSKENNVSDYVNVDDPNLQDKPISDYVDVDYYPSAADKSVSNGVDADGPSAKKQLVSDYVDVDDLGGDTSEKNLVSDDVDIDVDGPSSQEIVDDSIVQDTPVYADESFAGIKDSDSELESDYTAM